MNSANSLDAQMPIQRSPMAGYRRPLTAVGLGTGLENYDWVVYGLLTPMFAPLFFPGDSEVAAVLAALAVFAAGFAMRPIGAAVLGTMSDRIGRKRLLLVTISMMAGGSLFMGLVPTYAAIGIWAPIILVLLRLIQGLAMGAEQPVGVAYAGELAPPGSRASFVGVLGTFIFLGILLSSLLPLLISSVAGESSMQTWGWRVPFLVGGLLGLMVLWLRRSLRETHDVSGEQRPVRHVWALLRQHGLAVLATVFVVGAVQAYFYGWYSGLPARAQTMVGLDSQVVFLIVSIFTVLLIVLSPLAGRVADRFGIRRVFVTLQLGSIPPIFLLLVPFADAVTFSLIFLGGGVVLAATIVLAVTACSVLLPQQCRASGLGIGYALGVACFGGTAPYFVQWASVHEIFWLFPTLLAILLGVSVVLYTLAVNRTGIYGDDLKTSQAPQRESV